MVKVVDKIEDLHCVNCLNCFTNTYGESYCFYPRSQDKRQEVDDKDWCEQDGEWLVEYENGRLQAWDRTTIIALFSQAQIEAAEKILETS